MKRLGNSKSPGLDDLPYELKLTLSHMLVLILKVVFNSWFSPRLDLQGCDHAVEKGQSRSGDLDDYRPNIDLNILKKIMKECLQ